MRRLTAGPDSGAAAVEFALVSAVLFTLLFGIVQYGFFFFQATSVASLTSQVGRAASLREDCSDWQEQVAARVDVVGAAVQRVSVEREDGTGGDTSRGDDERVVVTWDPTEVGLVPFPEVAFTEETVVRYERLGVRPEASCTWVPTS